LELRIKQVLVFNAGIKTGATKITTAAEENDDNNDPPPPEEATIPGIHALKPPYIGAYFLYILWRAVIKGYYPVYK